MFDSNLKYKNQRDKYRDARNPSVVRMAALRAIVATILLSGLVGCFRPAFHPEGVSLSSHVAEELCVTTNQKRPSIESLRALVDATVSSGSESASFRYVVLSKEPSSFRIDVLPVNGAFTLGLLVAHNGNALWLNAQEKTFSEDRDERRLVADYLGLRGVSRETASALMTGVLPKLSCPDVRVYQLISGDRLFVDDSTHVAWHVRGESFEVVSVEVLDEKGRVLEMRGNLSSWQHGEARTLTLDVFSPATAHVDMRITRIVHNPKLNDQLFDVKPPSNYRQVD